MTAMEMTDLVAQIVRRAESTQAADPMDYIDPKDGLWYCGKCHTPKQCRIDVADGQGGTTEFTPPIPCDCQKREREKQEAVARRAENAAIVERLQAQCGMDNRLRSQTFEAAQINGENERAFRICSRYVEKFDELLEKNQGLLLWGDVGSGKTFAAACIANALLSKRVSVVMTSFVKLLEYFQSAKDSEETDWMRRISRVQLLVLDDLGAERGTEYALEKVYNVIDSRYRAGLPMILTTNLNLAEMQNATDIRYKRIYDRVFEVCYPVIFKGNSFRKAEAKKRFAEMKELLEG